MEDNQDEDQKSDSDQLDDEDSEESDNDEEIYDEDLYIHRADRHDWCFLLEAFASSFFTLLGCFLFFIKNSLELKSKNNKNIFKTFSSKKNTL